MSQEGFIYCLEFILPDEKYYKVGRSKNFDQRIEPYKKCGKPSTNIVFPVNSSRLPSVESALLTFLLILHQRLSTNCSSSKLQKKTITGMI